MTGLDAQAFEQVEKFKGLVEDRMRDICCIPEYIKFKGDFSAQGAAYYTKYLEDERQAKIASVQKRWLVSDSAETQRFERKAEEESKRDLEQASEESKNVKK